MICLEGLLSRCQIPTPAVQNCVIAGFTIKRFDMFVPMQENCVIAGFTIKRFDMFVPNAK